MLLVGRADVGCESLCLPTPAATIRSGGSIGTGVTPSLRAGCPWLPKINRCESGVCAHRCGRYDAASGITDADSASAIENNPVPMPSRHDSLTAKWGGAPRAGQISAVLKSAARPARSP